MTRGRHPRQPAQRRPSPAATVAGAGVRLERWHRRAVYAALGLLAGSGALWLLFHYFVRVQSAWGEGPHPLESCWLRLHGLAAMLALVALGSLLVTHIVRAWQLGRNRASGAALGAALLVLVASGYALYYFGGEQSRPLISLLHWVTGSVAAVLILAHVALGRGLSGERRRAAARSGGGRHGAPERRATDRLCPEASGCGADAVGPPGSARRDSAIPDDGGS